MKTIFAKRLLGAALTLCMLLTLSALVLAVLSPTAQAAAAETRQFQFQVTVTDDDRTFAIPVSGSMNSGGRDQSAGNAYDWVINWGDGVLENKTGTGSSISAGIAHTYSSAGTFTITISPKSSSAGAWLAAFGFYGNASGANTQANRNKVTCVLGPVEPGMTRLSSQLSGSNYTAPSYEWANTFSRCTNVTMGSGFTFSAGWQDIAIVGNNFANGMFFGCSGDAFTMNNVFNLPTGITAVGSDFASAMFNGCAGGAFTMNDVFSLPAGVTAVGSRFATGMFNGCAGGAFTMNDVFNLPTGITAVGSDFVYSMFEGCAGDAFTMNDVFNLPAGITKAGDNFAYHLFYCCAGDAFTMNEVFNLPAGITTVGNNFARRLFYGCAGDAFTMNDAFNLPAGITYVGDYFAGAMFCGAGGPSFQVNDVFTFPTFANKTFYVNTFYSLNSGTPVQNRTATSIIGANAIPGENRSTFDFSSAFRDYEYLAVSWGGLANAGIDDAVLKSVLGQAITASSGSGTSADPFTAAIWTENSVSSLTAEEIATVQKHATFAFGSSENPMDTDDVALTVGENTVYVTVTAVDGTSKLYYKLTVTREGSDDATLKTVLGQAITAGSGSGTSADPFTAAISVENRVPSLTAVGIVPNSDGDATFAFGMSENPTGTGEVALAVGENTVYITITAEDGATKLYYKLTIAREPSGDATLKTVLGQTITADGGSGTSADPITAAVSVENSVSSLTAAGVVPNFDGNATFAFGMSENPTGTGEVALAVGDNTVYITVTAEDGATKLYYKLSVTRDAPTTGGSGMVIVIAAAAAVLVIAAVVVWQWWQRIHKGGRSDHK